jgi:hypothetical protein
VDGKVEGEGVRKEAGGERECGVRVGVGVGMGMGGRQSRG